MRKIAKITTREINPLYSTQCYTRYLYNVQNTKLIWDIPTEKECTLKKKCVTKTLIIFFFFFFFFEIISMQHIYMLVYTIFINMPDNEFASLQTYSHKKWHCAFCCCSLGLIIKLHQSLSRPRGRVVRSTAGSNPNVGRGWMSLWETVYTEIPFRSKCGT
jgi:hypothetical protein